MQDQDSHSRIQVITKLDPPESVITGLLTRFLTDPSFSKHQEATVILVTS